MKERVGGYGEKERVFEMTMNVSSMELNVFKSPSQVTISFDLW